MNLNAYKNDIVKLACPTFKGRKVTLGTAIPKHLDSYWDEGYKTCYYFVRLADKTVMPLHSNHPNFEPTRPRYLANVLPQGWALVAHHYQGTKQSMVVYLGTGPDEFPVLTCNEYTDIPCQIGA